MMMKKAFKQFGVRKMSEKVTHRPTGIIKKKHVRAFLGCSASTLIRRIREGHFPPPDVFFGKSEAWNPPTIPQVAEWLDANGGGTQL